MAPLSQCSISFPRLVLSRKKLCVLLHSQTAYSPPTIGGEFPHKAILWHRLGTLKFSLILTLTRLSAGPTGSGLDPTRLPFSASDSTLKCLSPVLLAGRLQIKILRTASLGSMICYTGSQTSGEHLLMLMVYLKEDSERYKWTAKWRDIQGEVQKSPKSRSFCPRGVGYATLPVCGCVHCPGSCPNPVLLGFLWRLHHEGTVPFWRMGVMVWPCWWYPEAVQEPTKRSLFRTKETPITQKILRNLETLCQHKEAEISVYFSYSQMYILLYTTHLICSYF